MNLVQVCQSGADRIRRQQACCTTQTDFAPAGKLILGGGHRFLGPSESTGSERAARHRHCPAAGVQAELILGALERRQHFGALRVHKLQSCRTTQNKLCPAAGVQAELILGALERQRFLGPVEFRQAASVLHDSTHTSPCCRGAG